MLQKVSVIVPIYKVEKYIHRCVDSILKQTYTNLEIILVNDGSPDNCGTIIDEYASNDCRIIVVHKENGGLSDARNVGMEYVTGEYTLFVDSDDWLDRNMIQILMSTSLIYKADIVQSAFYYAYEDYLLFDNRFDKKDDPPIILGNKPLMAELVKNEIVKNFAWGKLYKTEIIRDIPFKKGVLFEDVFWAHLVMHRVNTYVILNEPLCFYLQRSDSIVSTYTPKNLDIIKGLLERHHFIEEFYDHLIDESYKGILNTSLIHYNLLLANRNKINGKKYRYEIEIYIKNNYGRLKKSVINDNFLKKQLFLFSLHPYLNICFLIITRLFRRLHILPRPIRLERVTLRGSGDL
ncbi:glycosyltransferase [Siminovitchia acidinfaciens]|uniref:Glycosyltransferase n=1 Tax=Siminovitchia acidinfaciens TaxID=2321395 RepID=A0A429XW17_9BACI|nr:glycosyltransferase family 2 protein [Siminovitchia acidinfaciens]RST72554.1 glycosyltransferase [Siminovitchia acidinfaciens]